MNGGIKPGTVAYDESSLLLNKQFTLAKKELLLELSPLGYTMERKLSAQSVPGKLEGICPDGGIWRDANNRVVAVFEGKKQGAIGNAHERWYKNHAVVSFLFPTCRYVTVCCGLGVLPKSTMYKGFGFALTREGKPSDSWNVTHEHGVSF